MTCKEMSLLRLEWYKSKHPGALFLLVDHRGSCPDCRREMAELNRLAQQPYTRQQEAAWAVLED